MPATNASTGLSAEELLADPRPYLRAHTIDSARELYARMETATADGTPSPWPLLTEARAAIRALIHELEAITGPPPAVPLAAVVERVAVDAERVARARRALAATRPLCTGTGTFIPDDTVDGNRVTSCPVCRRHTIAYPGDRAGWWLVAGHRAAHMPGCVDSEGKVECVCGLDDLIARINDTTDIGVTS